MSNEAANTEISQVDIELADILGTATGAQTITAKNPANLFKNDSNKETFTAAELEKSIDDDKKRAEAAEAAKKAAEEKAAADKAATEKEKSKEEGSDIIDDVTAEETEEQEAAKDKTKSGRKPESKELLYEITKSRIESGELVPFDDEKPLEEYTKEDYLELYRENDKHKVEKLQEEVSRTFFDSLPEEFQHAFAYFQNGGTNVKGILSELARSVQIRDLDEKTEDGQEEIARTYLTLTNFGDATEIDEEINEWKDRGQLEKKAAQFKPKLDDIQKQNIEQKLKQQERARKAAEKAAADYADTIYNTLAPGELSGIKLDKKTQTALYNGLVQPVYQSAFTGQPINQLGYLLEQKQFGKDKDPEGVALALWALSDKEGMLAKAREKGASEKTKEVVKKLKTEQQSRISGVQADEDEDTSRGSKGNKIKRTNNIFK